MAAHVLLWQEPDFKSCYGSTTEPSGLPLGIMALSFQALTPSHLKCEQEGPVFGATVEMSLGTPAIQRWSTQVQVPAQLPTPSSQ